MRIKRTDDAIPPDLKVRVDRVFAEVDKMFLLPFTGELVVTVVASRAVDMNTVKDVHPPRIL